MRERVAGLDPEQAPREVRLLLPLQDDGDALEPDAAHGELELEREQRGVFGHRGEAAGHEAVRVAGLPGVEARSSLGEEAVGGLLRRGRAGEQEREQARASRGPRHRSGRV